MSEPTNIRPKCPHGVMVPNICDACFDEGAKRIGYAKASPPASEAREWIIVRRPNGLGQSVMNSGTTFIASPDREYIPVIEYSAFEQMRSEYENVCKFATQYEKERDEHAFFREELRKERDALAEKRMVLARQLVTVEKERDELREALRDRVGQASHHGLMLEERYRLRAALERIASTPLTMAFDPKTHKHGDWSWLVIAREALAGG